MGDKVKHFKHAKHLVDGEWTEHGPRSAKWLKVSFSDCGKHKKKEYFKEAKKFFKKEMGIQIEDETHTGFSLSANDSVAFVVWVKDNKPKLKEQFKEKKFTLAEDITANETAISSDTVSPRKSTFSQARSPKAEEPKSATWTSGGKGCFLIQHIILDAQPK